MRTLVLVLATAALLTACVSEVWQARRPAEVWLLMGQSNMSGRGELAELSQQASALDERVTVWGNDEVLRTATEPVDDARGQIDAVSADTIAAVGPGMAFAKARLAFDGRRRIVLVPCAKGGTSIAEWEPAPDRSTLFGSCIARARAAEAHGRLAGALWYQGESDARTVELAGQWTGHFGRMVDALRTRLDRSDLPMIVIGIGDRVVPPDQVRAPGWNIVQQAQADLTGPNLFVLSAAGLPLKPDGLHLSTASQLTLGQRLADTAERHGL